MNELDYLIKQLDLLIGLLDVSNEAIYDQIKKHDQFGIGLTIEQLYESSYDNYKNHITTSAALLGFAHFEDFLVKCLTKYLIKHPEKNVFKFTWGVMQEKGVDLINFLATEQARKSTCAEKIDFIEKKLTGINPDLFTEVRWFNKIRNCLVHNNGLADSRLVPKYDLGQPIILSAGELHGYGLQVRQFAKEVWTHIK